MRAADRWEIRGRRREVVVDDFRDGLGRVWWRSWDVQLPYRRALALLPRSSMGQPLLCERASEECDEKPSPYVSPVKSSRAGYGEEGQRYTCGKHHMRAAAGSVIRFAPLFEG